MPIPAVSGSGSQMVQRRNTSLLASPLGLHVFWSRDICPNFGLCAEPSICNLNLVSLKEGGEKEEKEWKQSSIHSSVHPSIHPHIHSSLHRDIHPSEAFNSLPVTSAEGCRDEEAKVPQKLVILLEHGPQLSICGPQLSICGP